MNRGLPQLSRRTRDRFRAWELWRERPLFVAYCIVFDLLAAALVVVVVLALPWTLTSIAKLVLLVVFAIVFEESVHRAARLRLRLSADLKRDMTSVWGVAGAVALEPGQTAILLCVLFSYIWIRQQRPAGEVLSRKLFNASAALTDTLAAAGAVIVVRGWLGAGLGWAPTVAITVPVAIVVVTVVNRIIITGCLLLLGLRGRELMGSRDENLFELATLCLGGLTGAGILLQPWLAGLCLVPMVALQRGALVRELEVAAMTDAKTGLLNPLAWEQLAQREVSRARRESYALAVLIVDLDRFKLVNDRFGHLVGDAVLKAVGRCLQTETRDYDTIGRFGGEEFVAVLPETSEANAMRVAERIRVAIAATSVAEFVSGMGPDEDHMLSASIGVACTGVDGEELSELLYAADRALYYAKENGRNQVQRAGAGPTESRFLIA